LKWQEKYLPYLIDLDRLAWEEGVGTLVRFRPGGGPPRPRDREKGRDPRRRLLRRAAKVVEDKRTKDLLAELEAGGAEHLAKIEGYLADLPPAP